MSRLGQIHNDYLDPDKHLWPDEDYGYEAVLAALKAQSTGRWQFDKSDCCLSGKDADLGTGYMGIHFDGVDDEFAYATVHGGKTVVGDDCCFNLPDDAPEEQYDKAREAYLEQMTEVVCGCGYPGEWSGDDWFLTFEQKIKVPTILDDENGTDAIKTADALIMEAQKVLEPFEREMAYLEEIGSMLAGWTYARTKAGRPGRKAKDGKPSSQAAWRIK